MEEIKERLRCVTKIEFSVHAENKIRIRRIEKSFIEENLINPHKLDKFMHEPDSYSGEKYELYFAINKRKSLKVVVSFIDNHLNVITAHIISSKRLEWIKKWQKKRL